MTDTFNFPYHTFATKYPEDQSTKTFGGGWSFSATPRNPIFKHVILTMNGLRFYQNANGSISNTLNPTKNALTLQQFYEVHRQNKVFIYPHPVFGNMSVRFLNPVEVPAVGSNGVIPSFTITLIEDLNG